MLVASVLTLIFLAITTIVYFSAFLSPLVNLIVSVPILLLWTFGIGLLIYNMFGALGHACSKSDWGNDDGVSTCEAYKAMFAFVVLGWVFYVFGIVCDVKARRHQTSMGTYGQMLNPAEDKQALVGDQSHDSVGNDIPYGVMDQEYRDRPVASSQPSYSSSNRPPASSQPSYTSSNPHVDRFAPDYTTGHGDIAMSDFRYRATPQPQDYHSRSYEPYQAYR